MKQTLFLLMFCLAGCGVDFDFYQEHYKPCVVLCDTANDWLESCGQPRHDDGCVDKVWYVGYTKQQCDMGRDCYERIMGQECPTETPGPDWQPSVFSLGCPK